MTKNTVSQWSQAFHWGFGGFWYADQLKEIDGLSEDQLFWTPSSKSLCILWHTGHIAHRERFHIGWFLEGQREALIPLQFEVFGPEWASVEEVRASIGSIDAVKDWVRKVRAQSHSYIASLGEDDFHKIPASSDEGHSIAQVLIQTIGHTAVHIGRIQLLRALIEDRKERAC